MRVCVKVYDAQIRFQDKQMIKIAHKGCVELMGEEIMTCNLGPSLYQEVQAPKSFLAKGDSGKIITELGCPRENIMKISDRAHFKKKLNTKKNLCGN